MLKRIFIEAAILPVRAYQWIISPVLPVSCRHVPTCSQYAIEAIRVHGVAKGSFLAFRRILRCHPWGTHGHDPVPPKTCRVFRVGKKKPGQQPQQ